MARRTVSPMSAAADALGVLGSQIRLARHARKWTAKDLAVRAGVSPRTILAIESGAPGTAIGTVFNAAVLVGVPLFGTEDRTELARMRNQGESTLALIPSRVYSPRPKGRDHDFKF